MMVPNFYLYPEWDISVQSMYTSISDTTNSPAYSLENQIQFRDSTLAAIQAERLDIINKTRSDYFGVYSSCLGAFHKQVFFREHTDGLSSVQFSPTRDCLLTGHSTGNISLYCAEQFVFVKKLFESRTNHFPIMCIRFLPNNSDIFCASSAEGFVYMFNYKSHKLLYNIYEVGNEVNTIDIDNNSKHVVTGGKDCSIHVYDINTMQAITSFVTESKGSDAKETKYHTNRIYCVKFLQVDPNVFLSGGWDNMVKVWDLRTSHGNTGTIHGPHISGDSIDVRNNEILTGSWSSENPIQIWDLRAHDKCLKNIVSENVPEYLRQEFVYAAQFLNDDSSERDLKIVSSMNLKSVDVISINNSAVLHTFICNEVPGSLHSIENMLAFGGFGYTVHFAKFLKNISTGPNVNVVL